MNLHPKCLARSRPSVIRAVSTLRDVVGGKGRKKNVGKRYRTIHPDLTLVLQVALVGNEDDREAILVLHPQDLLVECADFLERIPGGDGVDEQESLARTHVLLPHGPAVQKTIRQLPVVPKAGAGMSNGNVW